MEEWLIILLRSIGLFVLLVLAVPVIGRKPLTGMTFFDYTVGLVLAGMIALLAFNLVVNLAYGLIGLLVWFLAIVVIQFLVQKSKWLHDHLYGKEVIVIKEGKVLEENLQTARLTAEELLSQLRRKNVFQVRDVEFAVMETNGDITTLLKREQQPITPKDLRIPISPTKEPQTVILDGNILDEGLTTLGLNRAWLMDELNKVGISAENVFIAQVDAMGELYLDLFDDTIQLPQPSTKERLFATLKKIESDFMIYALETKNEQWKATYSRIARELDDIIRKLEPHLKA